MNNFFAKTICIFLLTALCSGKLQAQGAQNNPYVDERVVHFGFFVGLNSFSFNVQPYSNEANGETFAMANASLQPGFSVGVITDLRLHRYWNLRFNPSLLFGERRLTYKATNTGKSTYQDILSVPICLPLYLKYSSERIGNYRPYLIAGVGMSYDLARNYEKPVLLRPVDFYVEFGVGCDFYFSFFKLAPELKFALGFNDMITPLNKRNSGFVSDADRKYTDLVDKMTSRILTLSFNIE